MSIESFNYAINKNNGEPYVHYTKKGYIDKGSSKANLKKMESDAISLYKTQSDRLVENFRRNEMPQATHEEAVEALKTLEGIIDALTKTSTFKTETANINSFKDDLYKVDGKSFWAYSTYEKNRDELFNDAQMLSDFVTKLGAALEQFRKTSTSEKELIMKSLEDARTHIPTKDALSRITLIDRDSKADIGLKKLIASVEILESYSHNLGRNHKGTKYTPTNITDETATEVIRALSGSLNGLKGGFFEVAVENIGKKVTGELADEILEIAKNSMGGNPSFRIVGASKEGDDTVRADNIDRMVVSKKDINMRIQLGPDSAILDVGLSLKTNTPKEKGGVRKSTLVGGANFGDLLRRSNAIMDESTYHLANIAAHNVSTSTSIYRVAKMKSTALMALDAISGLGEKADTAYFVLYTDKVLNMSTFLSEISELKSGSDIPIKASLSGMNKARKEMKGTYSKTEQYVRSHAWFEQVLDKVKVTINSTS